MIKTLINVLKFVAVLCIIFIINLLIPFELNQFGIIPRTVKGLIGIPFSVFLHGNLLHLASNSIPAIVLLFLTYRFYRLHADSVVIYSVFIGGFLVWIFGRSAVHIGASGLIYSLAAFLILAGILKRDLISLLISIIIIIAYGGMVWGLIPTNTYISWEAHLFGALTGLFLAYRYFGRKK